VSNLCQSSFDRDIRIGAGSGENGATGYGSAWS
jgi:hypothetical protein